MPPSKKRKLLQDDESASEASEPVSEPAETKPATSATVDGNDDHGSDDDDDDGDDDSSEKAPPETFEELGIIEQLCGACAALGYKRPTRIQSKAIPVALQGRDLIGLAETGSGKTAAFALPILQALMNKPQPLFALVLAPTRELAYQIAQAFEALGSLISVRCAVIVGGMDMVPQQVALGKKPHVVVATPGRLMDHLESTKGFSLRALKYLVMDEADRLLDEMDFGPVLDRILRVLPRGGPSGGAGAGAGAGGGGGGGGGGGRRTMLFSATMTSKVESLQRASLHDPVRVSVSASGNSKYQTVATLLQHYAFFPHKDKDACLAHVLADHAGKAVIVFVRTVNDAQRAAILLRALGLSAVPLHGQLSQSARLGALAKFRARARDVLVATDVAARGLDIPRVDLVLNYDLPADSRTYVHRVGRTARAGSAGRALSFVTQYDVEVWQRIERALGGNQLPEHPIDPDELALLGERVADAQRIAATEMKELHDKRGRKGAVLRGRRRPGTAHKRTRDDMDREEG